MSVRVRNTAFPLASAGLLILTLAGCESSGSYRVASVGAQGPQGIAGKDGPQGFQGQSGSGTAGANGGSGSTGPGGLDGTNAVATGGLVGPGGVAGTGLLANTGDPSRPSAGSGVLVASGTTASSLANQGTPLAQTADGATPGGMTLTGRVLRTMDNTGQALVQAGNGQQYLVDGIAAAPGSLVTFNAQDQRIIGQNGDQPLIAGTAVSSTTQGTGYTLTAGAANTDNPATVSSPTTGTITPTATAPTLPGTTILQPVAAVPRPQ